MRKEFCRNFSVLIILLASALAVVSCQYKEIANAEYPDQMIYMPAAKNGVYAITGSPDPYEDPTPGSPYDYYIDSTNGRLVIPLGVFRSGISRKGEFSVKIMINSDTVKQLIDSGLLAAVKILPSDQYTIPDMVEVENGKDHTTFNLNVDLSFLRSNPDDKFALGIEISSSQRKANPLLSTTVVLIDTNIIDP